MNGDDTASFPVTLLVTMVALALVLVIAWFAIRLLARGTTGGLARGGRVKVVQSVPVGARERVVLVEFDGRELLLGVTAGRVSVLESGKVRASAGGAVAAQADRPKSAS